MSTPKPPDAWLRGPMQGIDAYLLPAAHALVQAREDLEKAVRGLTREQLWARPGGAASVGFHLRHVAGSLDRLLTYARGDALTQGQREAAAAEVDPLRTQEDADALLAAVVTAVDGAIAQLRSTPQEVLLDPRPIGRARLPSTVLGAIFHAAEHAARHTGQAIATAKAATGRS